MAVFSVYAFWSTSTYFGENYAKTFKMGQNLMCLAGLFVLGLRPLLAQAPPEVDKLEIVHALWKERGLDNDFAVVSNTFVVVAWTLAIIAGIILLPPWRTARSSIARELVPGVLKQTVAVINGTLDKDSLLASSVVLQQGNIAGMALFEPPPPCARHGFLVAELGRLVAATDEVILATIAVQTGIQERFLGTEAEEKSNNFEKETSTLLLAIAKSLASNTDGDVAALERLAVKGDAAEGTLAGSPYFLVYERAASLRQATLEFLHGYNPSPDAVRPPFGKDFVNNLKIWIVAPFLTWPRSMLLALANPFRPQMWNARVFLWKLKRTIGAVAIFSMVIYWPAYANFAIDETQWRIGAVYYGWDLLGYCNSWRPTMEGTFKKGFQRLSGTCVGGCLALLGVTICRGSTSHDAEINPYGLIAYLTVLTTVMTFFQFKTGLGARFGSTLDSFYFWCYTLLYMTLLSVETFLGDGEIDGLVVNRIVATATGVVFAWIVAAIPPFVKGCSPEHAKDCIVSLDESFHSLLETYARKEIWAALDPKDVAAKFVHPVEAKLALASFLLTDASMYDSFIKLYAHNLAADPGLKPLLADIQVTITLLNKLVEFFNVIEDEQEETLRKAISGMLDMGLDRAFEVETGGMKDHAERQSQACLLVRIIHTRWQKHKFVCDAIARAEDNMSLMEKVETLERDRAEFSRELALLRNELLTREAKETGERDSIEASA